MELLKQLKHPNIVQYLGSEINETSTVFSLFLEFVSGGSIAKSLTERSAYSHRNANSHAPCSAARAHTAMCTRMQLKRPLPAGSRHWKTPAFDFRHRSDKLWAVGRMRSSALRRRDSVFPRAEPPLARVQLRSCRQATAYSRRPLLAFRLWARTGTGCSTCMRTTSCTAISRPTTFSSRTTAGKRLSSRAIG